MNILCTHTIETHHSGFIVRCCSGVSFPIGFISCVFYMPKGHQKRDHGICHEIRALRIGLCSLDNTGENIKNYLSDTTRSLNSPMCDVGKF